MRRIPNATIARLSGFVARCQSFLQRLEKINVAEPLLHTAFLHFADERFLGARIERKTEGSTQPILCEQSLPLIDQAASCK